MDPADQLGEAMKLLSRLGIEIREEHLGGDSGGLCALRGRRVVFIDLDSDMASQLNQCLKALASLPELENVYVPPILRELLEGGDD